MNGVRRWFRLRGAERDVDEEIAFYFSELVRDLEVSGLTPSQARDEAARRFGDKGRYRAEMLELNRMAAVNRMWTSGFEAALDTVKYAARAVVRSPGLSTGIVLTFALGIGANATMYETVDRLLLRAPAHIQDPDDVRRVGVHRLGLDNTRSYTTTLAYPDYTDLADLHGVTAKAAMATSQFTVGHGETAKEVRAVTVTASYWPLVGVQPVLGRFFTEEEDRLGGERVAVLSYAYWQREYGGRQDVLGQTMDFGRGPFTVIGVAPRGFTGLTFHQWAFSPLSTSFRN